MPGATHSYIGTFDMRLPEREHRAIETARRLGISINAPLIRTVFIHAAVINTAVARGTLVPVTKSTSRFGGITNDGVVP